MKQSAPSLRKGKKGPLIPKNSASLSFPLDSHRSLQPRYFSRFDDFTMLLLYRDIIFLSSMLVFPRASQSTWLRSCLAFILRRVSPRGSGVGRSERTNLVNGNLRLKFTERRWFYRTVSRSRHGSSRGP